jgi:hypothetical protein
MQRRKMKRKVLAYFAPWRLSGKKRVLIQRFLFYYPDS